ncbi:MAG: hypothetical protein AAF830_13235 [Pseudomonadota bacterium]
MRTLHVEAWSDMFGHKPDVEVWSEGERLGSHPLVSSFDLEIPSHTRRLKFRIGSATSAVIDLGVSQAPVVSLGQISEQDWSKEDSFSDLSALGAGEWIGAVVGAIIFIGELVVRAFKGRRPLIGKRKDDWNQCIPVYLGTRKNSSERL